MRHPLSLLLVIVCLSLASGPARAAEAKKPVIVHKDDQKKGKKGQKGMKGKKGKKGKKPPKAPPVERPATQFGEKGTWTLGGEGALRGDFTRPEGPGDDWMGQLTIKAQAVVSYFVVKGFELRAGPSFLYTRKNSIPVTRNNPYDLVGGAVIGGYYDHNLTGTLFLTAGLDAFLGGTTHRVEERKGDTSTFLWFLGPRLGLTIAFGGNFGGFIRVLGFFDYGGLFLNTNPGPPAGGRLESEVINYGAQTALGIFF
ncbi:MAG: hypothetical protein FJ098_09870 [Deltaproteobacteria bacterium]|nr:hypothetical protein [Deltaproteobacteria bacterium]